MQPTREKLRPSTAAHQHNPRTRPPVHATKRHTTKKTHTQPRTELGILTLSLTVPNALPAAATIETPTRATKTGLRRAPLNAFFLSSRRDASRAVVAAPGALALTAPWCPSEERTASSEPPPLFFPLPIAAEAAAEDGEGMFEEGCRARKNLGNFLREAIAALLRSDTTARLMKAPSTDRMNSRERSRGARLRRRSRKTKHEKNQQCC